MSYETIEIGDLILFDENYYGVGEIGIVLNKNKINIYSDNNFMISILTIESKIRIFYSTSWPIIEIL